MRDPNDREQYAVVDRSMDRANMHLMRVVAGMGALAMIECLPAPRRFEVRGGFMGHPKRKANEKKKRERKAQRKARRASR